MHRAFIVLTFLVFALPLPAMAQSAEVSEADQQSIRSVVEDQLAAFQRDDAAAAFSYASPMIQEKFGTPRNFLRMVEFGYPPVYRPQTVEFRDIVMLQGRPTQRVFLVGPNGRAVIALYFMELQESGVWKIDGCYLVKADENMV